MSRKQKGKVQAGIQAMKHDATMVLSKELLKLLHRYQGDALEVGYATLRLAWVFLMCLMHPTSSTPSFASCHAASPEISKMIGKLKDVFGS